MSDYVALRSDPYSAHQLVIQRCLGARRVLDVGASAGAVARELVAAGIHVDAIERDPLAAQEAEEICGAVLIGDVEIMELDLAAGEYDVIVMADVIEHLSQPANVMARLRPFLAPQGRLVVTTPNIANWSMRLLHLAGRWDYTDRGIMDRSHVRFFTRRTVMGTIEDAGYRILEMDVTCPIPVLRREPFNRWAHWTAGRWPTLLAYQFLVVAEPGD